MARTSRNEVGASIADGDDSAANGNSEISGVPSTGDALSPRAGTADAIAGREGQAFDGAAIAAEPEQQPKKQRKPRGPNKPKQSAAKAVLDSAALAQQIEGAHQFAALFLGAPIIALSPDESRRIADACCNVAQYYDLPIGSKQLAWLQLAATLGMVYGSRYFAYRRMQANDPSQQTDMFGETSNVINWGETRQ